MGLLGGMSSLLWGRWELHDQAGRSERIPLGWLRGGRVRGFTLGRRLRFAPADRDASTAGFRFGTCSPHGGRS